MDPSWPAGCMNRSLSPRHSSPCELDRSSCVIGVSQELSYTDQHLPPEHVDLEAKCTSRVSVTTFERHQELKEQPEALHNHQPVESQPRRMLNTKANTSDERLGVYKLHGQNTKENEPQIQQHQQPKQHYHHHHSRYQNCSLASQMIMSKCGGQMMASPRNSHSNSNETIAIACCQSMNQTHNQSQNPNLCYNQPIGEPQMDMASRLRCKRASLRKQTSSNQLDSCGSSDSGQGGSQCNSSQASLGNASSFSSYMATTNTSSGATAGARHHHHLAGGQCSCSVSSSSSSVSSSGSVSLPGASFGLRANARHHHNRQQQRQSCVLLPSIRDRLVSLEHEISGSQTNTTTSPPPAMMAPTDGHDPATPSFNSSAAAAAQLFGSAGSFGCVLGGSSLAEVTQRGRLQSLGELCGRQTLTSEHCRGRAMVSLRQSSGAWQTCSNDGDQDDDDYPTSNPAWLTDAAAHCHAPKGATTATAGAIANLWSSSTTTNFESLSTASSAASPTCKCVVLEGQVERLDLYFAMSKFDAEQVDKLRNVSIDENDDHDYDRADGDDNNDEIVKDPLRLRELRSDYIDEHDHNDLADNVQDGDQQQGDNNNDNDNDDGDEDANEHLQDHHHDEGHSAMVLKVALGPNERRKLLRLLSNHYVQDGDDDDSEAKLVLRLNQVKQQHLEYEHGGHFRSTIQNQEAKQQDHVVLAQRRENQINDNNNINNHHGSIDEEQPMSNNLVNLIDDYETGSRELPTANLQQDSIGRRGHSSPSASSSSASSSANMPPPATPTHGEAEECLVRDSPSSSSGSNSSRSNSNLGEPMAPGVDCQPGGAIHSGRNATTVAQFWRLVASSSSSSSSSSASSWGSSMSIAGEFVRRRSSSSSTTTSGHGEQQEHNQNGSHNKTPRRSSSSTCATDHCDHEHQGESHNRDRDVDHDEYQQQQLEASQSQQHVHEQGRYSLGRLNSISEQLTASTSLEKFQSNLFKDPKGSSSARCRLDSLASDLSSIDDASEGRGVEKLRANKNEQDDEDDYFYDDDELKMVDLHKSSSSSKFRSQQKQQSSTGHVTQQQQQHRPTPTSASTSGILTGLGRQPEVATRLSGVRDRQLAPVDLAGVMCNLMDLEGAKAALERLATADTSLARAPLLLWATPSLRRVSYPDDNSSSVLARRLVLSSAGATNFRSTSIGGHQKHLTGQVHPNQHAHVPQQESAVGHQQQSQQQQIGWPQTELGDVGAATFANSAAICAQCASHRHLGCWMPDQHQGAADIGANYNDLQHHRNSTQSQSWDRKSSQQSIAAYSDYFSSFDHTHTLSNTIYTNTSTNPNASSLLSVASQDVWTCSEWPPSDVCLQQQQQQQPHLRATGWRPLRGNAHSQQRAGLAAMAAPELRRQSTITGFDHQRYQAHRSPSLCLATPSGGRLMAAGAGGRCGPLFASNGRSSLVQSPAGLDRLRVSPTHSSCGSSASSSASNSSSPTNQQQQHSQEHLPVSLQAPRPPSAGGSPRPSTNNINSARQQQKQSSYHHGPLLGATIRRQPSLWAHLQPSTGSVARGSPTRPLARNRLESLDSDRSSSPSFSASTTSLRSSLGSVFSVAGAQPPQLHAATATSQQRGSLGCQTRGLSAMCGDCQSSHCTSLRDSRGKCILFASGASIQSPQRLDFVEPEDQLQVQRHLSSLMFASSASSTSKFAVAKPSQLGQLLSQQQPPIACYFFLSSCCQRRRNQSRRNSRTARDTPTQQPSPEAVRRQSLVARAPCAEPSGAELHPSSAMGSSSRRNSGLPPPQPTQATPNSSVAQVETSQIQQPELNLNLNPLTVEPRASLAGLPAELQLQVGNLERTLEFIDSLASSGSATHTSNAEFGSLLKDIQQKLEQTRTILLRNNQPAPTTTLSTAPVATSSSVNDTLSVKTAQPAEPQVSQASNGQPEDEMSEPASQLDLGLAQARYLYATLTANATSLVVGAPQQPATPQPSTSTGSTSATQVRAPSSSSSSTTIAAANSPNAASPGSQSSGAFKLVAQQAPSSKHKGAEGAQSNNSSTNIKNTPDNAASPTQRPHRKQAHFVDRNGRIASHFGVPVATGAPQVIESSGTSAGSAQLEPSDQEAAKKHKRGKQAPASKGSPSKQQAARQRGARLRLLSRGGSSAPSSSSSSGSSDEDDDNSSSESSSSSSSSSDSENDATRRGKEDVQDARGELKSVKEPKRRPKRELSFHSQSRLPSGLSLREEDEENPNEALSEPTGDQHHQHQLTNPSIVEPSTQVPVTQQHVPTTRASLTSQTSANSNSSFTTDFGPGATPTSNQLDPAMHALRAQGADLDTGNGNFIMANRRRRSVHALNQAQLQQQHQQLQQLQQQMLHQQSPGSGTLRFGLQQQLTAASERRRLSQQPASSPQQPGAGFGGPLRFRLGHPASGPVQATPPAGAVPSGCTSLKRQLDRLRAASSIDEAASSSSGAGALQRPRFVSEPAKQPSEGRFGWLPADVGVTMAAVAAAGSLMPGHSDVSGDSSGGEISSAPQSPQPPAMSPPAFQAQSIGQKVAQQAQTSEHAQQQHEQQPQRHFKCQHIDYDCDQLASTDPNNLLSQLHEWNYPIFELSLHYGDSILSKLTYRIFIDSGFFETFKIPEQAFFEFFHALEQGYYDNPYHNRVHAADVLHAVYYLTSQPIENFRQVPLDLIEQYDELLHSAPIGKGSSPALGNQGPLRDNVVAIVVAAAAAAADCERPTGIMGANLTALEVMALYTAAAMHDFQHPGRTNSFLVATSSPLALLYNDRSVLENHHSAASWALFHSGPKFNWLLNLEKDEFKRFRFMIIELILATDLMRHYELVSAFNKKLSKFGRHQIDWFGESDRLLVMEIIIKLADVNGPMKDHKLHRQWTERIASEFYEQGDDEKAMGLPVSLYMDRQDPRLAELQKSFINHLVGPLSHSYASAGFFPGANDLQSEQRGFGSPRVALELETCGGVARACVTEQTKYWLLGGDREYELNRQFLRCVQTWNLRNNYQFWDKSLMGSVEELLETEGAPENDVDDKTGINTNEEQHQRDG